MGAQQRPELQPPSLHPPIQPSPTGVMQPPNGFLLFLSSLSSMYITITPPMAPVSSSNPDRARHWFHLPDIKASTSLNASALQKSIRIPVPPTTPEHQISLFKIRKADSKSNTRAGCTTVFQGTTGDETTFGLRETALMRGKTQR